MAEKESLPKATAKGRPDKFNTNVMVTGTKGFGKTAWIEEILLSKKKRLIIVDPQREYGATEFCKACNVHYDAMVSDLPSFKQVLSQGVRDGNFRIIARIPEKEPEIFKLIKDDPAEGSVLTNTTVLAEEITHWMSSYNCDPSLYSHLQYGRHNENCLVGACRYPYELNPLFRGESDIIISFHQSEKRAIDYFADFDKEASEELRDLKLGEYRLLKGTLDDLLKFMKE